MIYGSNESRLNTGGLQERSVMNGLRAIVWILVAAGSLILGLIGGTVVFAWKREWAWVFPAAAFAAYLLAFRHGMFLWNPAVDRTWRRSLRLDEEVITEDDEISRVARENPEKAFKILRRGTPRQVR